MISLQVFQTFFKPRKHPTTRIVISTKKYPFCCSSRDSSSSSDDTSPQGDTRKQDMLARIAMLQTSKVRLSDYLDEKASYLTQFAEEADAEFEKIGEEALKGLDEASSRIMENIESRMQAFEESAEMSKIEIERSEKELMEFEGQIEEDRNEGLFFKSFTNKKPIEKANTKEETEKIKQLNLDSAASKTRRNIYLGLICVLVIGIADSLISSPSSWLKPAIFGVILVGVTSQVIYEQKILSETITQTEKSKNEED